MKRTAIPMLAIAGIAVFAMAQDRAASRGATTQDAPVSEVQGKGKTRIVPGEAGWNPAASQLPSASRYDTGGVSFAARMLHPEQSIAERSINLEVQVAGIQLVDPESVNHKARDGQGHLTYRIDSGPVIVTTATRLSFTQLPGGGHRVLVELAANDGTPLGPHQVFHIEVPRS